MNREIELPPEAGRLIEGLRDTGYTFETAVADIIDNSIAADADEIHLIADLDYHGRAYLMIADNGTGMNHEGLKNAMKYGSKRKDDPNSLGKFGLGLKTSSTAFARSLSVLTRFSGDSAPEMAVWDLDHIGKENAWKCQWLEPDVKALELLNKITPNGSGTVVLWSKIDRLLKEYQDPGSNAARKAFNRRLGNLELHLGEVFERFLDTNNSEQRNIIIKLNRQSILPWNPFCEDVGADMIHTETRPVELPNGTTAEFKLNAWVIPHKSELNDDQKKRARTSNDRQGFYMYRHGRMIQAATTLEMWKKEPHLSLLRIEFDFDHRLDEAFAIDIKKSQVTLNDDLWRHIFDGFIGMPKREAERRVREATKNKTHRLGGNAHKRSNDIILKKEADVGTPGVKIINSENNEVEITNSKGKSKIKLKIGVAESPDKVAVIPKKEVEYNQLYEPAFVDGHQSVHINTSHDYYRKVYLPNIKDNVLIPGMDSLLWALSVAELKNLDDKSKRHFEEMRIELSRILSRLVEDLPEPNLDNMEPGTEAIE